MVVAEICSILENWRTSSFDTYMYSTRNPNLTYSTGTRVLCLLGIATIALNKSIKGKGRFEGASFFVVQILHLT